MIHLLLSTVFGFVSLQPSTSRKRKSVDPGPAITSKKSRSSTATAAKRKKATPAAGEKKPRQTKGKSPAAAKKKATSKRSPKTADHPSTSGCEYITN